MSIISLPAVTVNVMSNEILNRIPVTEVIYHYGVMNVLRQVHTMVGDQTVLERISDEAIIDHLISRGFNIEM